MLLLPKITRKLDEREVTKLKKKLEEINEKHAKQVGVLSQTLQEFSAEKAIIKEENDQLKKKIEELENE